MGKRGLGLWVLLGFTFCLAASALSAPTCMRFLEISTLPRIAGMGDAGVAVGDATWAEINPAHLINVEGSLVTFSHTAWFQDINLENLSLGTVGGDNALGVSVIGLTTDPLDGYDYLGVKQGEFRFYDLAVAAAYARRLYPSLSVGASGKVLYEKIDWDSASGFAVDLGVAFAPRISVMRGRVSLGAVLRNLGPKMGYFDDKFDLPLSTQAGLSYRPMWLPESFTALVAVDYDKTRGRDGGPLVGLEVGLKNLAAVRVGYRDAYDNGDLTYGFGLGIRNVMVDYAYVDMGEDLGRTHRVSVAFKTGAIFPSPEASR
jgi:hypothetical protein